MFKKPVKIGAQNQLSGKDKKTVKNKFATIFNAEAADKLFSVNEKIICNKITGSKMLIYTSDDYPLFVDGTGKQDFFPSVYVCAAFQTFIKNVVINEGVESYIFNGANLMWPGVRDQNSLGKFKKDDIVAIQNSKRQVIAVGALGCSFDELKSNTDGSGIAVYILHYKGDKLWDMGDKVYPDVIIKAVEEKIEQPKVQAKVQVKKQTKEQVQEKVQKIQEKKQEIDEVEPSKGKGKKKKEVKVEQPETEPVVVQNKGKNIKKEEQKPKQVSKKQEQPVQSSEDEADFGNLVHNKKPQKGQIKMQKKKNTFSDEQDDKKGKKKGGKKGGNKKKNEDQEQQQPKPTKKQNKKQLSSQQQEIKEQNPKQNKNKKKKQASQNESEQDNPKQTKNKKKKEVQQNEGQQQNNKPNNKNKKKKQAEQNQNEEGEKSAISTQLMDQYFRQAFLNVLKLTKVEAELPLDSGRFFSDYMVLARSEDVKLEIKDSSFKKLGKFYEQMAKQKFIEFKPAKEKKGQQGSTITKIIWQNQELKSYFPTIKKMGEKDVEQKTEEYSKQKLKLTKTLQIEYVYKLNEELKKILYKKVINYMPDHSDQEQKKEDPKKQIFLSEKDLKQKIEKYINDVSVKDVKQTKETKEAKETKEVKDTKDTKEGKGMQKKVQKLITINYKQNQFVMNLLKNEIQEYEQMIKKEQMMAHYDSDQDQKKKNKKNKGKSNLFKIERGYIVNKIMKLAHPHYNMVDKQYGLNKFKQGVFKGIQLIADKIMNKNVTKVIGLESFSPLNVESEEIVKQIHGFAHLLQLKFASSSNVQNLPGKNAGKEILIQGNFVDELQSMFITEYGIKKEHITIQNKLGKKKKN